MCPKSSTKEVSMTETALPLSGTEHWANKDGVRLFLWNKCAVDPATAKGVVLSCTDLPCPGSLRIPDAGAALVSDGVLGQAQL
jgi:hypothetical protein